MATFLTLNSLGDFEEKSGTTTSAGSADNGKLVQLGSDGKLDPTVLPNGVGADANTVLASEALLAGDFVNVYNNSGVANCRKADATAVGKQAMGYVLTAVASGAMATIYFDESNSALTGLTPGAVLFLSDSQPGKTTSVAPTGTGKIVQRLGVATSATAIHVNIDKPVIRA